jgi:hypothetical protein
MAVAFSDQVHAFAQARTDAPNICQNERHDGGIVLHSENKHHLNSLLYHVVEIHINENQ